MQAAVNGIIVGCTVALSALGLTLIWGIEGFPNIAQGDILTLAAYVTYMFNTAMHFSLGTSAGLAIIATAGVVLITYIVVFRPLRHAPLATLFVASIGVALVIRAVVSLVWGTEFLAYRLPITRDMRISTILVSRIDIAIMASTVGILVLLYLLLFHTRIGTEMRAVADVRELARVSGINSERVISTMWIVSGVVTAAAGVLLGAKINVYPLLGWNLLLAMFAATILGGVGSIPGAVVGGLTIGIASEVMTVWISSTYKVAIAFVFLSGVLIVRPNGIFGGK